MQVREAWGWRSAAVAADCEQTAGSSLAAVKMAVGAVDDRSVVDADAGGGGGAAAGQALLQLFQQAQSDLAVATAVGHELPDLETEYAREIGSAAAATSFGRGQ